MKLQKVNLVYFSATKTTAKVAQAIGEGTGLPVSTYDFTYVNKQPVQAPPAFGADELVVVGAPVYFGRIPVFTLDYLKQLKGSNTPCVLLGVYGNRHYDDYLVELEDLLKGQGFVPVAAGAFVGEHSFSSNIAGGRPNEQDLQEAKAFGKSVMEKLSAAREIPALAQGTVPGNRPYKEGGSMPPIGPVANEKCTRCGQCAAVCPMGAIDPEDVTKVDGAKCVKCRACARVCPVGAIDLPEAFQPVVARCEAGFSKPDKANQTIL